MRHHAQKGLFHANLLHALLELFPVTDGTILDFGALIIDSVHRIVKELGNLRTVLDAQTDKGKLTVHFYSDEQLRAFANLLGQYQMETE